jgi:ribonucleoside-diphosphate reductase alpha chain
MTEAFGPKLRISEELHALKYRSEGETFYDCCTRIAGALTESDTEFHGFRDILLQQRFLPGGRIQSAIGSPRAVTAFNCFVSGTIEDNMQSIMQRATEAAMTMRTGGGIGYDFSKLRPKGDWISTLDSHSSGPISFMGIFNAICHTISSAGHRRGAQMAVLRIDHPDVMDFIQAKQNSDRLTAFNISLGVTDRFMEAVEKDEIFELTFNGKLYNRVKARQLWEKVMRSTWEWAEPGVIYLDTINRMNNLWYCEKIEATNPCGEQPLPPYGACLLGSFNLTKYLDLQYGYVKLQLLEADVAKVVRAMDRVIDVTDYPLTEQKDEAHSKRRMGLGVTGVANTLEACGLPYGTAEYIERQNIILSVIRDAAYRTSVKLAKERGPFPLCQVGFLCDSPFINTLPKDIQDSIDNHGIRNSHLLSIAPTGTISMCADNISSGIEPTYAPVVDRVIQTFDGPIVERIEDYGVREFGNKPRTATQVDARDHVAVLCAAQKYIDSAVSKTINVSPDTAWNDFKELYFRAWRGGAKGCTTFNPDGGRKGILTEVTRDEEGIACRIDPETGSRSCDE